jgi:hypothetical protein
VKNLEARIKELAKEAASHSRQGVVLINQGDRKQGHSYMRQAYEASKRCQILIQELKRQGQ